ncbi:hypothetical protein PWT90_10753 [Aphanocladium album]|nr:hypothetical protein PWT90_10753 [Aphanocladium album]
MRQPSRVLQHGACNTSRRIGSVQQPNFDTRARDRRDSFALLRTPDIRETKFSHQKYYTYQRNTNSSLLQCSKRQTRGPAPKRISTTATISQHDNMQKNATMRSIKEEIDKAELDASDGGAIDWNNVVLRMDRTHGAIGVCAVMDRLRALESLEVVMESDRIRNAFVYAATSMPENWQNLFVCANQLLQQFEYRWPNLYAKCIHHLLEKGAFREAVEAHLCLTPQFLPDRHILGLFFENFVLNPSDEMQVALKTIYISLPKHNLYDIIIPALFKSGQSILARAWRQTCLLRNDLPSSECSAPFLMFLSTYYSNTNLMPEEHRLVALRLDQLMKSNAEKDESEKNTATPANVHQNTAKHAPASPAGNCDNVADPVSEQPEKKSMVDGIVEKLFASNWTPIDFTMQLAKTAGMRAIGARGLQALALRAKDSAEVNESIKSLKKLEIAIPANAYCIAISEFARQGHDALLSDLLHSDIHPEEFDDQETRQMILDDSIRRHDTKLERLMRGVLNAIDTQTRRSSQLPFQLSPTTDAFPVEKLLFDKPWRMKLALQRMTSLDHRLGPVEASAILRRAFAAFPIDKRGIAWNSKACVRVLDEVIGVVRTITAQNIAIPAQHWKVLLLGLGYQGRFDMMEQLSLEIVNMYDHNSGGLLPIHKADLPKITEIGVTLLEHTEFSASIPADLSFYHHHHPLSKVFDGRFQRMAVQLGFNWALGVAKDSKSKHAVPNAIVTRFNVASGIRILANLRDRGVFIDIDVVESAARNGLHRSQQMRQRDGDTRGRQWLSSMRMKDAMDLAWGSVLMPTGYITHLSKKDLGSLSAPKDDWRGFCWKQTGETCK